MNPPEEKPPTCTNMSLKQWAQWRRDRLQTDADRLTAHVATYRQKAQQFDQFLATLD